MPSRTSNSILVFVDFSEVTPAVADVAMKLALASRKKLVFIHVVTADAYSQDNERRQDIARRGIATELPRNHVALGMMEAESKRRGIKATSMLVREKSKRGNATAKMLREITRLKPEFIVMGTHGHGALYNLLLGSASTAVISNAICPVVLVPRKPRKRS